MGESGSAWATFGLLIAGGVVGVFGTAFWERVGNQWSNETWIALAVATVAVAAVAALVIAWVRRGHVRRAVAAVGVAGLLGVTGAVAVLWDSDAEDACGRAPADDALDVVVVWEGAELSDFCGVVAGYGPDVEVTSTGPTIWTELDDRFERDEPPDVAVIPQTSVVRDYAEEDRLCPTPDDVAGRFPAQWNRLVTAPAGGGQNRIHGAIVKAAHKSLFWYDIQTLGDDDPTDWSWDDLVGWVGRNVDNPSFEAPLALPAGDGWPLTDWFENQLAGIDPQLYGRLARGETVDWGHRSIRRALEDMARLWREAGVLAGGPEGAAATSWSDLPGQLVGGRAGLAFGPSFVAGAVDELPANHGLWVAGFPRLPAGSPTIVGGDFAVVPASPDDGCRGVRAAQGFVEWLTDEDAIEDWSRRDSGFLTPNEKSPYARQERVQRGDWEDVRILLTHALINPRDGLHFDLSDDRFAVANQGDVQGSWDILVRFFQAVTDNPPDVECVLDQTIAELEADYRGDPLPSPIC